MKIKHRDNNSIVVEAKSSTFRGRYADLPLTCLMLYGQGWVIWMYITHQITGFWVYLTLFTITPSVSIWLVKTIQNFLSPVEIQTKTYSFNRSLDSLKDEAKIIFPLNGITNEICKLSDIECIEIKTECKLARTIPNQDVLPPPDWTIHQIICKLKSGEKHILQCDQFVFGESIPGVEESFRCLTQQAEATVRIVNDFIHEFQADG